MKRVHPDFSALPLKYLIPAGVTLLLVAASKSFLPMTGEQALLLLYPIVFLSSLIGGFGPGLLSLLISTLGATYLLRSDSQTLHVPINPYFAMATFSLSGLVFSYFSHRTRAALNRECTARRQAERAMRLLQQAEEKFRNLIESAPDAMVIMDSSGLIHLINRQTEVLFGYSRAELIGKPAELLLPEESREEQRRQLASLTLQAGQRPTETSLSLFARKKDGSSFPVDIALSPLRMGDSLFITADIRDISERVRLENQRRSLFELGTELATSLDYSANLQKIAQALVPKFSDCCVVYGPDEHPHEPVRVVADRDLENCAALEDAFRMALIGPFLDSPAPIVNINVPKNDELDPAIQEACRRFEIKSYVILPMSAHGCSLGAMGLFFRINGKPFEEGDLPFYKELSNRAALALYKARLYRQAQDAIRGRDDIIAVISHDLKNPLAAIQLNAQLLSRLASKGASIAGPYKKFADRIMRSVTEMHLLISNLLDFDKIRAGVFALEPRANEIHPILERCLSLVEPLATAKSLKLETDIDSDLPQLMCDPDRICQVFSNLVGNAIKFTESGGSVCVQVKKDLAEIIFSVTDSGPGIDPNQLPHVFNRYWQSKGTSQMGHGLGLFIAKGIVEAHQGRIWVESQLGQGSSFYFTIPVPRPEAHPTPAPRMAVG